MNSTRGTRLALPVSLFGVRLPAVSVSVAIHQTSLTDVLAGNARDLAVRPLPDGLDGQLLCGVVDQGWRTLSALDDRLMYVVRRDVWHYLAWPGSYEAFIEGRFSAKTRESFTRDEARFVESYGVGGALDVRTYHAASDVDAFVRLATPMADGGLPVIPLRIAAEEGRFHGLALFAAGEPVAFVCLQAQGETLQYLRGGERDDFRAWSAGTLIHLQAFRRLFADERFRLVDFRPGESEVKRQFANGSLRAAVALQLRRGLANRLLLSAYARESRRPETAGEAAPAAPADDIHTLLGEMA